jgi:hypothetical protein
MNESGWYLFYFVQLLVMFKYNRHEDRMNPRRGSNQY